MHPKDALGRYGEDLAAEHLRRQGLTVLARNWRCARGELDIVARDGSALVICEVKTRRGTGYGHPVEAVEMTGGFADIIRAEAAKDALDVKVIQRDVFTGLDDLRTDYQLILLSEVVSDFRNTEQLRGLLELAAHCLAPGGRLLFNIFLVRDGHTVDAAGIEFGQQAYTSIFTREELAAALSGLPLELVADDSVYEYEKAHVPADKWPPTSWYENWTSGLDVFDVPREQCPIEMRWLVFRKEWLAP